MSSPVKIQTVGEATTSIKGVVQSTFSSLSNFFNLPQLRDSFFQNIIYILIVIIILVGILVYIQMVGVNSVNPLSLPPTKEVKKIEIQKVVEGFDMEQHGAIEDNAENIDMDIYDKLHENVVNEDNGNMYSNQYDDQYHEQYNDIYGDELSSHMMNKDYSKKNNRKN
jgi:hypothetical protein